MTRRRSLRRRAALVVLLPALVSAGWLTLWERATRGDCCDDVCVCATLCVSRAACHGDQGGRGTRLSRACSKGEEAALQAPLPGLLADATDAPCPTGSDAAALGSDPSPRPGRVPPQPHPPPPPHA